MTGRASLRLPAATLAALVLSLVTTVALATSDGGLTPRLLAFAGPDERWAIVALESVQESCGVGPCTVVAIDLGSTTYRERWPYEPTMRADEVGVGKLVADFLRSASLEGAPTLEPLRVIQPGEGRALAADEGRIEVGDVPLVLTERRRVASMRPYSRSTQASCGMFTGGDRCSSCEETDATLNAVVERTWVCDVAPGTFAQSGAPCDCHAEARVLTLGGRGFVGREILVAPYRLAQYVMNGPGSDPDTDVALREARVHQNATGVPLVLAGAVHAPMANGTWFPLISYRLRPDPPSDAVGTPTPMTPGAGDDVVVEVRTPPGGGGCARCSVDGDRPSRGGLVWWLLPAVAFVRRRT